MDSRPLGNTGLRVTPIGFGAFKIGRNEGIKYASGFCLPDDRESEQLLNRVLDEGINFIDTAPAYGLSEERIGRAIAHRRTEYVLSTKAGEVFRNGQSTYSYSATDIRQSVERSLRKLKTDVLDLVFVHAHGDDVAILKETDVAVELRSLRDVGKIRAIGFSGKTVAAAKMALSWADALMVEYHLEDDSHAQVMEQAARQGVGVIVKKGLASGQLDPTLAIPHVLRNPSVTSLLIGTLNPVHLKEAIKYGRESTESRSRND